MSQFKEQFIEQWELSVKIIKWILIACLTGLCVGVSTSIFLKSLHWAIHYMEKFDWYYYLLPAALLLSYIIIIKIAPEAQGHGTEKVIEAIHEHSGKVDPWAIPVKLVATIITIACGGSAGKEGPSAQIGAGVSSLLADVFRFCNEERKKIVICGIAAAFAAVFGTPVGGAIFAVEILYSGRLLYNVLLPAMISGIIGQQIAAYANIGFIKYPMASLVPEFTISFFTTVILAGIAFGTCTIILVETFNACSKLQKAIKLRSEYKAIFAGLFLLVIVHLFSKDYLGLGSNIIHKALSGEHIVWYGFLMKILFTAITLSFGGSGGVVTPIFFIGCTAGALFGDCFEQSRALFAAIGLVSLLSGAANSPIAAVILSAELFGSEIVPYATMSCVISYFMTGSRSVYHSQIMWAKKNEAFEIRLRESEAKANKD